MEESDQLEQPISDMKVKLQQIETVDDRIREASEDCDPETPTFPESYGRLEQPIANWAKRIGAHAGVATVSRFLADKGIPGCWARAGS